MKRKPHSTSLVLLLVCIFTFWWGISVLAQRDLVAPPVATTQTTPTATTAIASTPLSVSETIKGTTYYYSGVFTSKDVCYSFGSGIKYSAADGGHVSVLLLTEPATTNCAQTAGTAAGEPFNVSIKLAGAAPVFDGVLLNGAPIPAQLVKAN